MSAKNIFVTGIGDMVLDVVVIGVYLVLVNIVAMGKGRSANIDDFFIGGRSVPWFLASLSIVATETSTLTFLSIPGLGYSAGLGFLQVAAGYVVGRILVAIFLVGPYFSGNIKTAYQYLQSAQSGPAVRRAVSLVFMATRVLADSVRLFASAIPLALLLGTGYREAILLITVTTFIYTSYGGIRAVIIADSLQLAVYLLSAGMLAFFIINQSGGTAAELLSRLPHEYFSVVSWGGAGGPWSGYTLLTGLVGGALLSFASHGTDHLLVQRLLSCRTACQARKALVMSGFLVFFQFALFLLLGMLIHASLGGKTFTRSDEVMPYFITSAVPPGLRGFMLAGVFAAAMSSLSSTINSLSSATILDFIPAGTGEGKSDKLMGISRGVSVVWTALLAGSAMLMTDVRGSLVETGLGIASITYGPVLAIFLYRLAGFRLAPRPLIAGLAVGIAGVWIISAVSAVFWTWYVPIGLIIALFVAGGLSITER